MPGSEQCGDGILEAHEACDPSVSPGLCSATCELLCGNGVVDPGETCDLGEDTNDDAGSFCTTACRLPFCGDGLVGPEEDCDLGAENGARGSLCTAACRNGCGNGVVEAEEWCDFGAANDDRHLIGW